MSERTEESLKARVRETPLIERLNESRKRIAAMCSERRGPKMTIPVEYYDDDFFICATLEDARDEVARLRGLLAEVAHDCEHVGSIQHLDKAERRTWTSVANRIKAAITPQAGEGGGKCKHCGNVAISSFGVYLCGACCDGQLDLSVKPPTLKRNDTQAGKGGGE